MAEFEEQKKFWRIFYSPLVFILLLAVFLFMGRAVWRVYSHEKLSAQDLERTENKLASVNEREAVLKKQVDTLGTPQGIDDEIRSKFNVTKAGEGVAVIVNDFNATSATSAPAVDRSWWQNFVGFFGG
jgi:cell division protein FtsB